MERLTTVSGKEIMVICATRLPDSDYQWVKQQAKEEGISVAAFLQRLVQDELRKTVKTTTATLQK